MESIIEQQRRYHEERERCIDSMVKENVNKKNSHRDNINSEHRTKMMLDRYFDCTEKLKEIYQDKDGERKEEIQTLSGPNEFVEFYKRLKSIKEFYKRHPNEISVPMSVEFEEYNKMRESNSEEYQNLVEFTDEEGYGKHLDLHELYTEYLNIKGVEKYDYINYLSVFDRLYEIPKDKKGPEYKQYLEHLLEYLYDFLARIKPLGNFDAIYTDIQKDFYRQWDQGSFPGWPKEAHTTGALSNIGAHLDLSGFNSVEELISLGLDRLKSALVALNLKCGGTLEERAKRLFSVKGLLPDEFPPELLVKKKGGKANASQALNEAHREIGLLEAQVYRLAELLSEQRAATKENVTRKQARTEGEREDEDEEEPEPSESEDDEDDDIPYNPKNLPLGWDGKPIPYWLYKLHGLNISYNCEICGNFTYKGPKAFQRHFAEWRHAHGMRCLGIPNTAHFANVTQIEDAIKLWDKIKDNKTADRWVPEQEEEFEDSRGNVVNRKTYEDLKRQGLL